MMRVATGESVAHALCMILNAAHDLGYEVQICEVPEDGSDYLFVKGGYDDKGVGVGYSVEHNGRQWKVEQS